MVFSLSNCFRPQLQTTLTAGMGCAMILSSVIGLTPTAIASDTSDASQPTLENGTYLFGEAAQSDQIDTGYIVFTKQDQKVVGAFYYPQSEFSCFTGDLKHQKLDVTAFGTYDQEPHTVVVPLSQMHSLQQIGTSERQALTSCRQEIAEIEREQEMVVKASTTRQTN